MEFVWFSHPKKPPFFRKYSLYKWSFREPANLRNRWNFVRGRPDHRVRRWRFADASRGCRTVNTDVSVMGHGQFRRLSDRKNGEIRFLNSARDFTVDPPRSSYHGGNKKRKFVFAPIAIIERPERLLQSYCFHAEYGV